MKNITKQTIINGLKKLGLKPGDIVLVHSSLSSLGYVNGGADTVIDALLETVGEKGTVLVPTLTGSEKFSPANPPVFDPEKTPCWTGIIPETFRKRKSAIRSLSPTHSVAAIGGKAKLLTKDHLKSHTPCDKHSPYCKVVQYNGYVLFIGCNLNANTMFHTVEELTDAPCHLQPRQTRAIIFTNGRKKYVNIRLHEYHHGGTKNFTKPEPVLLKQRIMRTGKIGNATVRLVKAKPMLNLMINILTRHSTYFLVK